MPADKLLSIIIPVYNGGKYIGGLLESFAAFAEHDPLGEEFLSDCEILVVNNRSEDSTLATASSYEARIKNLRVITPANHVPTAEENVFRAFRFAKGEYTWVLGCDDIVRFEALPDLLQVARDGAYDIAVFNVMQSDENGRLESLCNYFMRQPVFEGNLLSLTQRLGFWWLIAGFSGQIVRTSRVVGYDHAALVSKTSPIYSHVTAYLECLANLPAAVVNVQSVIYRLTDNDFAHWHRTAARLEVFDEYFWTLGYIRQIKYLESRGVVERNFVIKMVESNRSGFFRPTLLIYEKTLSQLQTMGTKCNPRNWISQSDFDELIEFFEHRDLLARPFLSSVKKIYQSLVEANQLCQKDVDLAHTQLQSYRSNYLLAANFIGIEGDYEIYRLANEYFAVHRFFRGALLDRIRYLDHVELVPLVFHAKTRADVAIRVAEAGIGIELDDVPRSLIGYCSLASGQKIRDSHLSQSVSSIAEIRAPSDPTAPVDAAILLRAAHAKLRSEYKGSNPYVTRLFAWGTVLGLKVTMRLLGFGRRQLRDSAVKLVVD